MSKNGIFSGPYFFVFGLNTEIHSANLRILRENTDQIGQFVPSVTVICKIISRIIALSKSLLIKYSKKIKDFLLKIYYAKIFTKQMISNVKRFIKNLNLTLS